MPPAKGSVELGDASEATFEAHVDDACIGVGEEGFGMGEACGGAILVKADAHLALEETADVFLVFVIEGGEVFQREVGRIELVDPALHCCDEPMEASLAVACNGGKLQKIGGNELGDDGRLIGIGYGLAGVEP